MYLDPRILRLLGKDEFRILRAIELGMRNHEIVPFPLIVMIAKQKNGGTLHALKELHKHKLIHHENVQYDGYRLTTTGYDYLALHTLLSRGSISALGNKIGVGKESDIYQVTNENGDILILKLHRLGRTSFRAVKSKRDYLKHRKNFNWLYLSRLAALGEFAFMKALGKRGFPVPEAIDQNRHAVLMSEVIGYPMSQVSQMANPDEVFSDILYWLCKLAEVGLVHCDLNEFNIMISKNEDVTLIDFPQMISINHENAQELFERDLNCILTYFKRRYNFIPDEKTTLPNLESIIVESAKEREELNEEEDNLDVELLASGFNNRYQKILQSHMTQDAVDPEDISEKEEPDILSEENCSGVGEEERVKMDIEMSSTLSKAEIFELKKHEVQTRVSKQMKKLFNTKVKGEAKKNVNREKSRRCRDKIFDKDIY